MCFKGPPKFLFLSFLFAPNHPVRWNFHILTSLLLSCFAAILTYHPVGASGVRPRKVVTPRQRRCTHTQQTTPTAERVRNSTSSGLLRSWYLVDVIRERFPRWWEKESEHERVSHGNGFTQNVWKKRTWDLWEEMDCWLMLRRRSVDDCCDIWEGGDGFVLGFQLWSIPS